MRFPSYRLKGALAAAAIGVGLHAVPASAVDIGDRTEIHGFGFQGYVQTSGNEYLGANHRGTWDYNTLSLIIATKLDDKTKLWSMLDNNPDGTRLGWMFVDRQLGENITVKAGQSKLPWGLYGDILDARALQQSAVLPAIYSDAADMRDEAYRGGGITYTPGNFILEGFLGQVVNLGQAVDAGSVKDRRLIGGRATYKTPVEGLRLMASAFSSGVEDTITGKTKNFRSAALSADFVRDNWDVKAEYAKKTFEADTQGYYVQVGYMVGEKWTPYARYDYIVMDKAKKSDPSYYQKSAVVGIDYKITGSVSVRLEEHLNHGYGLPVGSAEVLPGAGKTNWRMFAASLNFLF